jgi:hypothetical protein
MISAIRCGVLLSLIAGVSGCAGVKKPPCDDRTVSDLTTLAATNAAALEGCHDFMAYQAVKHTNDEPKYDMKSENNIKAACQCLKQALAEGAAPTLKEECKVKIDASLTYENEKCRR